MSKKVLYREYDEEGKLIKFECSHCHEIKIIDNFNKCKSRKDGVENKCKECVNISHRKYYKNNKEKAHRQCKEYRLKNKEKEKERHRKYYLNNRDDILKKCKIYNLNNKDKRNIYRHQYYLVNKPEELTKGKVYRENNKEKICEYHRQLYENNVNQEISKIYENVTKQIYPHNDIQYGIIYGVHCKVNDRWYIGQTTSSFIIRYHNNFFNSKNNELSEDNPKLQLLQDDIEKYGQVNFEIFEVIDVAFSEKELDEKEAYYIDYYKAYDEGYNSNRGNIFKHNKSKRKDVI